MQLSFYFALFTFLLYLLISCFLSGRIDIYYLSNCKCKVTWAHQGATFFANSSKRKCIVAAASLPGSVLFVIILKETPKGTWGRRPLSEIRNLATRHVHGQKFGFKAEVETETQNFFPPRLTSRLRPSNHCLRGYVSRL